MSIDTLIDDIALRNSETDDDSLLASLTEQEWADYEQEDYMARATAKGSAAAMALNAPERVAYQLFGCLDRPVRTRRTFATISFAERAKVVKAATRIANMVRIEHRIADLEPDEFERLELRYHAERLHQAETRLGDYIGGYGEIERIPQDAILAVAYDIDRRFKEYAS